MKRSSFGKADLFIANILAWVMALFLFASPARAAGQQVLRDHIPQYIKSMHLPPLGWLASTKRLNLTFGLPLRNTGDLGALLQQIYDPTSPNYRHYLTPQEFTERFGPTEQDYQAVIDFAKANGLSVVETLPGRISVVVQGTVADVEKVLHVSMRTYQHPTESRTFFAPDVEPVLDLAVPILHISGLDNFSQRVPKYKRKPASVLSNAIPFSGSGPSNNYIGTDFRAAYVPGTTLTGIGQTVALLQFDDYYTNDIKAYETLAGLPNVTLTNVLVGPSFKISDGNGEVSLDIQMVISMAPGISKIVVYEATNDSTVVSWATMLGRIANDNVSRQISCSWGENAASTPDPTSEQYFTQMTAQGQTFFNATGDSDAFSKGIPFPSESTNVVQVGATTLTTGPGAAYTSETVWNWGGGVGSSGGVSSNFLIPPYQLGISTNANKGSMTRRNVPDVAFVGDNVYNISDNGATKGEVGGTSCAAPLWAGFTALINQQAAANGLPAVGFLNPAIYTVGKSANYSNCFHDIATGNNFRSGSTTRYPGVAGYDLCTGWGTPKGTNLIAALAGLPTPTFPLSIVKTGAGGGTITSSPSGIDCGVTCSAPFASNTVVNLTATPNANSSFVGWSGAASGSTSTVSIAMTGTQAVSASFNLVPVVTSAAATPITNAYSDDPLALSNVVATDAESDPITLAYQWQFTTNGTAFLDQGGATLATLPAAAFNSGKLWRCRLTPNDPFGTGTNFFTAPVAVNNRPNMLGQTGQFYTYDSDLFLLGVSSGGVTGVFTRSAIINEFSQGTSGSAEWVELLFLKNSDARGWKLFDSNSGTVTFSTSSLWTNVPAGTLLVVYNGLAKDAVLPADDTDSSDGKLVIAHNNATYFSGNWISLGNSGDSISLADSSSTLIDGISYGSNNSQTPQLGTVGGSTSASYTNNTEAGVDLASNWQIISGSSATPAAGNGTVNSNFVASLRGGLSTNIVPLFRFGASSDIVPGLSINVTNGLVSGIINSPTGGFYNVVIERYAGTNLVAQQYNLLVGDLNNVYTIPAGKTWAINTNYTLPGTLIVQGVLDTVGRTLVASNTLDVSSGTVNNAYGLIVYHNIIGGPLPGTTQQFNTLPVISAASISPGSPVDTDDLIASVDTANDADNDPITFAYQWQDSGDNTNFNDIAFTTSVLTNAATTPGQYYRVVITPNDGIADGAPFTTDSVQIPPTAVVPVPDFVILSIQPSGLDIVITYGAVSNNTYELQADDDLTLTNWTGIVTNTVLSSGPAQFIDPGALNLTNRMYRVHQLP